MHFIFKFYLKKVKLSLAYGTRVRLEAIDGQNMLDYIGREWINIYLEEEQNKFDYFEVVFCATSMAVLKIRGIESDHIKPELIKHAIDVNSTMEQELKEYIKNNQIIPGITTDQIQEIIDRSHLYGQEFVKDLVKLMEEYPIKVELVKVHEDDNAFGQRKVTKI